MNENFDLTDYTIYGIRTDENLLVGIPAAFDVVVQSYFKEYGSFENVPSSKTVRGVFIRKHEHSGRGSTDQQQQENDVTVNQLFTIPAQEL